MFITRDLAPSLIQSPNWIQILLGPRQCGKSTLLHALSRNEPHVEINFDDYLLRQLANRDPALFLQQYTLPLLLDEVQYVPMLFPELKKIIDHIKREALFTKTTSNEIKVLFRLTGSNQILMDRNIKESLAGRASYFYLNTLTVHEILNAYPDLKINTILFKGGWPELYTTPQLLCVRYLNDYLRTYVEKDIVMSAGIQKTDAFYTVLGLLAARTGQLLDYSDIARDAGVSAVTIKEWVSLLERADLIYLLKPYASNLNKRLTKMPKIYFLDTGLAARLQGWQDPLSLSNSPQIGGIFETLVFAEILKFIRNTQKNWQLFFWRTKEGEEIDFLIKANHSRYHALEVKLAIQGMVSRTDHPPAFQKHFQIKSPLVTVIYSGQKTYTAKNNILLPIADLYNYLQSLEEKEIVI